MTWVFYGFAALGAVALVLFLAIVAFGLWMDPDDIDELWSED